MNTLAMKDQVVEQMKTLKTKDQALEEQINTLAKKDHALAEKINALYANLKAQAEQMFTPKEKDTLQ